MRRLVAWPLGVVLLSLSIFAAAPADHKRVLVLYSIRRDAQFSILGERELPKTLVDEFGPDLDYYSEFIDTVRFPDASYRNALREFLKKKYQGIKLDLVIAVQDIAVELLNTDALFRDTPEVFIAVDSRAPRRANSAGLIHGRDFRGTVSLMRRLQPDLEHVYIVTGANAADGEYEEIVRRQLQSFSSQVTLTYLSGLSTAELTKRLAKLPAHSAVYYVLVNQDATGEMFHPLDYARVVAAAANAPTYSWTDSVMDHGIVGGSLYRQKGVFDRLGELAIRVLHGEDPDRIPISVLSLNVNEVDWRELRHWGLDEALVPEGTIVSYRNPGVWERYRAYILAGIGVLILQTLLIATLLIQRRRRRIAERQLQGSQTELLKIYERNRDLGARLLQAQESERSRIAGELHDDICQRMLLLTMELESLRRTARDEGAAAEALSVAQGISKSLHELSHRLHPTRLRLIGLVGALDQLSHELSRAGVAIVFTYENVPAVVPPDVMLCLFRAVQEALQNAIKYSHARELSVSLVGDTNGLTVSITDDGVGFDVEAAWGKGLGLVSMSERMETIGGSLDIQSLPGQGARVTATVPLRVLQVDETVAV